MLPRVRVTSYRTSMSTASTGHICSRHRAKLVNRCVWSVRVCVCMQIGCQQTIAPLVGPTPPYRGTCFHYNEALITQRRRCFYLPILLSLVRHFSLQCLAHGFVEQLLNGRQLGDWQAEKPQSRKRDLRLAVSSSCRESISKCLQTVGN